MEKRSLIISGGIIVIIFLMIGIISLIFYSPRAGLSPGEENPAECRLVGGGEGDINIVFFSTLKQAEEYKDFFLSIFPFNETKENFNFYYIKDYQPECEIYKEQALLCYNKEIIKKASSCPNDFIVVIKEEEDNIRSSAYMNVMSLNEKHPLSVFIHEFGHVFANLAEEYVPANLPAGAKNCVADCEKFEGLEEGCFEGCSKAEYYRSINSGVMRTLSSEEYGSFNENLILNRINKNKNKITGYAIKEENCGEKYYLIEGAYLNGEIKILEKSIESGCVDGKGAGDFSYKIILKDDSVIEGAEFNPSLIFTDSPGEEEINGEVYESTKEFYLKLPLIENAKSLEIIKKEESIKEINLEDIGARPCKN